MKKKVLLSSIATIALCLCLIAGSTFALFTSNSDFNISVTAGDVEILATAGISGVYSAEGTDGDAEDKYLIDEHVNNYRHAPQTLETDAEGNVIKGIFSNGGDAVIDGANLVINRITPGDRVDVDINVQNLSNVAISYRYKLEANDTPLAEGMVVTIDGKSYEAFASWTSEWFTLDAPGGTAEQIADADAKTISVELPVYAGNEYENQTVEYTILVEAVQGNAVTENEADIVVYPTFNAIQDVLENDEPLVKLEGDGNVNLDETVVDKGIYSTGNVTISNGKIDVDFAGFQNIGGDAVLNDMTVEAGTATDYGVIASGADSETVLNNTVINSAGGAVGAVNGAQVTFNSGSVEVDSTSTSGRYLFYAAGEGTVITINGGSFDFNKTQNQKRAYIYADAGATVYVNGGTFGKASTRSGYTAGILGSGAVIITGGTFGFDPSNWVTDGYQAIKNGTTWYVVPENVDEVVVVSNATELQNALDDATGDTVIYVNGNIQGDVTATQKANVKTTIEGNGYTFAGALTVDGKSARYESAGLTIKNFSFETDSLSKDAYINLGVSGNSNTRYTNNVTVKGCTFSYSGAEDKVAVKSYTGGDKNLTLDGLTVNAGMHSMLQVTNVEEGLKITDCKVNAKNGINLNNTPALEMSGCEFDTEGYCVRFGVNGSTNNGTFTIANSTLISANDDGDAVIILRGTMTGATLTLTDTTLTGTPEITGDANIVR